MLESFVKVYEDRPYRFPTLVNHAGTVVAFAMDDQRRIRYAVLALRPDDPLDVDGWPADPAMVPFPRELVPVGFAATDPTLLPQVALGTTAPAPATAVLAPADLDPVLSSTARLSAAAPFQVVSSSSSRSSTRSGWSQSTDPAAAALRQARQPAQRPACWRLLHRVTYVSRILEPISPQADAFTRAMRALDLNSNYGLVRTLAPYVAGRTARYGDFVAAVRQAVHRRLPDLLGHLDQVTDYLAQYYGLDQAG